MSSSNKGQVSVEYLSYVSIFLLIAISIITLTYVEGYSELERRNQVRFRTLGEELVDTLASLDRVAKGADKMEWNISMPVIVQSSDIHLEIENGMAILNGTIYGKEVVYSMGSAAIDMKCEPVEGEGVWKCKRG